MDETLPSTSAKGIVALVAVNLFWNIGIWRCLQFEDVRWALSLVALLFVAIGTLVAQTFVLSVWMAFSQGRWIGRWVVPGLVLIALAMACGLGAGTDSLYAASLALPLAVLLGILVALLIPLRRACGWRLTARQDAVPGVRGRFGISDLLIWMVIIALPLAIVRVFATLLPPSDITTGMRAIALSAALLLPLLWLVLLAAFAPRGRQTYLLAGTTVYAGAATGLAAWFIYPVVEPLLWPLPGWLVVLISVAFFASGAVVVALCCLALRALGYRLLRPAWAIQTAKGESAASTLAIDPSRPPIE